LRRAHFHGPVDALPAHAVGGVRALHAPGRARHQPVSHQLPAGAAAECPHRAAIISSAVIPASPLSFPRRRESKALAHARWNFWIPAFAGMTKVLVGMTALTVMATARFL